MTPAETVGAVLGLATLGGLFARYVALPYLKTHLIDPVVDKLTEIETAWKLAALMYESHITRSAEEWGRLWEAIADLRKDKTHD